MCTVTPIWNLVRYFNKPPEPIQPLFDQGAQIYTADEKAEILAERFERIHRQTIQLEPPHHTRGVERAVGTFLKRHRLGVNDTPPISLPEVRRQIAHLKRRTAPGEDGITPILNRHFSPSTISHLTYIFNYALSLGHFPRAWKHANVLAIQKPHKPPSDPWSYRPIRLLSALSKLLERVVARRMEGHARRGRLIPNEQFGFRKRHSTVAKIARLTEHITHGYNINKHTGMVLLDIEKAYDTVCTQGLLFKLLTYNFPA